MRRSKLIPTYLLATGAFLFMFSCSDENPSPVGTVNLTLSGTGNTTYNSGGRISGGRVEAAVEITDFQISVRDVVFKTDVDDNGIADDSTEVVFSGPYALDLLDNSTALSQSIGSAEAPTGVYEELRFVLHKTRDVAETSPLYDRSIFVKGTIDGTPFEMWHDTSENLDIGKSTGIVVDENGVSLDVTFSVDQFMDAQVQIDLSQAVDGDGDGVIEINPNDDDGNKEIADALKENIKAAADILEE